MPVYSIRVSQGSAATWRDL